MRAKGWKPDSFERDRELLDFARAYLREMFPNPDRLDCPSDDALRFLAAHPLQSDPAIGEHLTCCSPCLTSYMIHLRHAKAEMIERRRIRRSVWFRSLAAAACLLATVAIGLKIFMSTRRPELPISRQTQPKVIPPEETAQTAVGNTVEIDLSSSSPTRGSESARLAPQIIPSGSSVELSFRLPFGSEEGLYSLTLSSRRNVVWSGSAQGNLQNGYTFLRVHTNLSRVPVGEYELQVVSTGSHLSVPIVITPPVHKTRNQDHEN